MGTKLLLERSKVLGKRDTREFSLQTYGPCTHIKGGEMASHVVMGVVL